MFDDRLTIIAEIGSNHDGDLGKALATIDAAAECGADIAKFQSFLAEEMVAPDHPDFGLLKRLEMPREWYPRLMEHCTQHGLRFLSTATNFATLGWMEELGAWGYKVASGNITHEPMIERLIEIGKPMMVSTGLATLDEVVDLARRFHGEGLSEFAFFHCVSSYPTRPEAMRLRNISVLREVLPCPVGFSDHSAGVHLAVAAVALGARIVEKHMSLDRTGISPDHSFALVPEEFAELCRVLRETDAGLFADFALDTATAYRMRRSLHFARSLPVGAVLSANDVKVTRPEEGLRPDALADVVGRRLARGVTADQPVSVDLFDLL